MMSRLKISRSISTIVIGVSLFSTSLFAGVDYLQFRSQNTKLTINPGQSQTAAARCEVGERVIGGFYNLNRLIAGGGNSAALASGSADVVRTSINEAENRYSVTVRVSSDAQGAVSGNVRITATCAPQSDIGPMEPV